MHGGSGLMTSWECLRHTRKNIWQFCDCERQTPPELVKESIFSSKTPEERVYGGQNISGYHDKNAHRDPPPPLAVQNFVKLSTWKAQEELRA